VTWNFHTPAAVSIAGATARLAQNGKTMQLKILEPAGATFETLSASAPAPQKANRGVTNLTIHLPSLVEKTRIVVLLSPGREDRMVRRGEAHAESAAPLIEPLKNWIAAGPIRR
jgi:hypothetical protein